MGVKGSRPKVYNGVFSLGSREAFIEGGTFTGTVINGKKGVIDGGTINGKVCYTIEFSFDMNGAAHADKTEAGTGETVTLTATPANGYRFKVWNVVSGGVTLTGNAFVMGTEAVEIKAVFEENRTCNVSFDANGGSGEMTAQTFTKGKAQALKANAFTRKNFYFTGWNTKADGSGDYYANKAEATFTANTTLYAQWARVPSTTSYTVQYNANGSTGSVYLQAFTSSMTFNLRMNEFVREGYKFVGWNTKADGTGDAYAEGANFSGAIKKSIVLYAQWKLDVPEFPAVRPEYKIEVEGQEGKITRLNDTSIVFDKMYIRWSIGFDTVDGPFAMIAILDVVWEEGQEGIVGTFTIPVIQTNGTISGVNYMLTTDPNANMVGVGEAAKDMYGMLIK